MSFLKQKEFAVILFVISLVFLLFNYYTGIADPTATEFINWGAWLWNFSMIIGTIALFREHGTRIVQKKKDWQYSGLIFVAFVVYFATSYIYEPVYNFILNNIQTPIMLAIWISGFTTFTMLFRGARTRNWLGILLLASSILTVLMMAPIGAVIWPGFPIIGQWISSYPNSAVMSAITICMGVGLLATLVREIFGKETHYLGD
jgi:hypothetical protein